MRNRIGAPLLMVAGLTAPSAVLAQDGGGGASGKVSARVLLVVDDPDGGAMTRQLTQSAALLFASMSDRNDEVGLYVESTPPVRLSPQPVAMAISGMRAAIGSITEARPAAFGNVIEYAAQAFGAARPGTRNAIVVIAHSPREGEASPEISPEVISQLERWKMPAYVVTFGGRAKPEAYASLTRATGGQGFGVLKGADLKAAFNAMLSKLHDVEGLPVVGDRLVLDDSVKVATVVVPKGEGGKVRIVTPSERILGSKTKYPGVDWQTFDEYDLVRIENPEAGTWRVRQPAKSDGGIVGRVESELELRVAVGPRSPMVGDTSWIEAYLERNGKTLDAYATLKHMVFEAEILDPSGRMRPVRLERGEAGRFRAEIVNDLEGYHEVKLSVFSPEIQRERRLSYRVNPACFIGSVQEGIQPTVTVHMSPTCPRFAELYAKLTVLHDGEKLSESYFERSGQTLHATSPAPELGQAHELRVSIQARTMDGHDIKSDGGGPYKVAARDPTMLDYVLAVGKRLALLNVPFLVGGIGMVVVRQKKKGGKSAKSEAS